MRLLRLLVPILFSIILIVLDTRFSYLDNFKRFTLTLLSPIYFVVDLPNHVIDWVNDKGTLHNLHYYQNLMHLMREAIKVNSFTEFKKKFYSQLN